MNDFPRQKLQEIVTQYGHSAYHDPRLCKALLRDFCGQYRKEISVLVGALEEGIPAQILASNNTVPHAVLIAQFIKKLQENLGLTEEAARWAAESWFLALGVSSSSAPQQQEEQCCLQSHRGIDYTNLRDLLVANKWKEADIETRKLMLKAAHREKQGWFDSDSIKRFPCEDLQIIDKLWLKHSNGKSGFSVQKKIYQGLKTPEKSNVQFWDEFATKVSWKTNKKWLEYDKLRFSINYNGHLPTVCYTERLHIISWSESVSSILWLGFGSYILFLTHESMLSKLFDGWQLLRTSLHSSVLSFLFNIISSILGVIITLIAFYAVAAIPPSIILFILKTLLNNSEDEVLDKFFKKISQCNI